MPIHLISDLHLSDDTDELNRLFLQTLQAWQGRIDALYILGDLFEYWVGDDDDSPFLREMLAAMQRFAAQTPLYVMHGNRDFLLGEGFERASGARLLADPHLLTVNGVRYLLSHGDALCTDDAAYQAFRAQCRSAAWQQAMLARPLAERHQIARLARQQSEAAKLATGLNALSDVTDSAVAALLCEHDWPVLVHGHTHRPASHEVSAGSRHSQRWVIADWHDGHGGYLTIDKDGIRDHRL